MSEQEIIKNQPGTVGELGGTAPGLYQATNAPFGATDCSLPMMRSWR